MSARNPGMRLHDAAGRRLYLSPAERGRFIALARIKPVPVCAFCLTLAYTGCRVSEALAFSPDHLDAESGVVMIRSLKKRRAGHVRELPIPGELVTLLSELSQSNRRFWPIGRATAWRRIKEVMAEADVIGLQASPKGLRHTFAVHAVLQQVPPGILQKWWATPILPPQRSIRRFAERRSGLWREECGNRNFAR